MPFVEVCFLEVRFLKVQFLGTDGAATRRSGASRRRLSRERHHMLELLASSEDLGVIEAVMMAHGCSAAMLSGMVCDGFITVVVGTARTSDRTINVRRLRITDAGRKAIKDA
jgi:hypothetical protein